MDKEKITPFGHRHCLATAIVLGTVLMPVSSYSIQFTNQSSQAGMLHPVESWGSAWGDYDGDHYPDLWTGNHRGPPTLYRNNQDGTFTNIIQNVWSANPDTDAHGAAWADFDRDGDRDLLEQTGGSNPNNPNAVNQFYVNNGGLLEEKAAVFGLDYGAHRGRSVLWFDYDNDGNLDVSLTGYTNSTGAFPASVFRQNPSGFANVSSQTGFNCPIKSNFSTLSDVSGDGILDLICHGFNFPQKIYDIRSIPFTDITSTLPTTSLVFDSAFADFNGDLQADVLNVRIPANRSNVVQVGDNEVHARLVGQSNHQMGFTFTSTGNLFIDLTSPTLKGDQIFIGSGGLHPDTTYGITRASFNLSSTNPQHIGIAPHNPVTSSGLYIGYNTQSRKWEVELSGANTLWTLLRSNSTVNNLTLSGFQPSDGQLLRFYTSSPAGYVNSTTKAGFSDLMNCVSVAAGDFDNDMDMDAYLVCEHSPENLPNRLYENLGDNNGDGIPEFTRVPGAGGASGTTVGSGKNVAMADYDLDGFLDLFVSNGHGGGSVPNGPDQLFHNSGNSSHWIQLDLEGVESNVHGIGARVIATAGGKAQLREQASGTHSYTQNHERLHFGLSSYTSVDLKITWPSGNVDIYDNVAADTIYRAVEKQGIEPIGSSPPPLLPPSPDEACGEPDYDPGDTKAIFIWKDCSGSGQWHVRASAGGDYSGPRYSGTLESDLEFSSITPFSLETDDTLDVSINSRQISFSIRMWNAARDGFDFNIPASAEACLNLDVLPPGTPMLAGAGKVVVDIPFNLNTMGNCQ